MASVVVETRGAVATVTINRPEARNALNSALLKDLYDVFQGFRARGDIHAVILTGAEKGFVAGADIGEMKDFTPREALAYARHGAKTFSAIEDLPQPVIAAINGHALGGGCEIALACDIRLASDTARFGQPEVGLGITPGFGGTQRLPRTVGVGHAMRLILSGELIDAAEALRIGLVNAVHPPEELQEKAMALAKSIAEKAPLAVRAAKKAIREGGEEALFAKCFDTEDQKDAMAAFVEKRRLDGFKGK